MTTQPLTQHEIDRRKIQHDKRHFDRMSTPAVLRALMWRERTKLLFTSNLSLLAAVIMLVF